MEEKINGTYEQLSEEKLAQAAGGLSEAPQWYLSSFYGYPTEVCTWVQSYVSEHRVDNALELIMDICAAAQKESPLYRCDFAFFVEKLDPMQLSPFAEHYLGEIIVQRFD